MDHRAAGAQCAHQGRHRHRQAAPALRDAQRLHVARPRAQAQQRRGHQRHDVRAACAQRKAGAAQRPRRARIEAGDDDARRQRMALHGAAQRLGGVGRLQLDDQRQLAWQRLDGLVEGRHAHAAAAPRKAAPAVGREARAGVQPLQLGHRVCGDRAAAVGGALQRRVVEQHQLAVARDAQVELERIGAPRHRLEQRRKRVLRRMRAIAAVRDHRPRQRVEQDHPAPPAFTTPARCPAARRSDGAGPGPPAAAPASARPRRGRRWRSPAPRRR